MKRAPLPWLLSAALPCPHGMLAIEGQFCIDRFEASTRLVSGEMHSPEHAPGALPVVALSERGAIPQAQISLAQAEAACQRAGKALCTPLEWRSACKAAQSQPDHALGGVHDLNGNLLEWIRAERPLSTGARGCSDAPWPRAADHLDAATGFRCCAPLKATTPVHDPPGVRSFDRPGAPLPKLAEPAGYADGAACPLDMQLVEGARCSTPIQACRYWVDEPGKPQRACGEFEPVRCAGPRREMRFCIDRFEYTPAGHQLPLVHVSWNESERICRRLGKRLCFEDEWEFACEGPEAWPYPYGHRRNGAACNHDVAGAIFTPAGRLVDRRVPATSLPDCKSPFGVFNLVGNVDEWTTRAGAETPWRSILRGGWWLTGRNRCRAATGSHNEIYAGPQTGFRCCKGAR